MKTNKTVSLLALFFLFAVTACDDDNDNDVPAPDMASFSVSISGDLDYTTEGQAFFTTYFDPEFEDDLFIISMTEGMDTNFSMSFMKSGDQPGTGVYPVVHFDFEEDDMLPGDALGSNMTIQVSDNDITEMYYMEAKDGSITFEESSGNRVRGSFEYEATGFNTQEPGTELQAEVSGTFDAMFAEPGEPVL